MPNLVMTAVGAPDGWARLAQTGGASANQAPANENSARNA